MSYSDPPPPSMPFPFPGGDFGGSGSQIPVNDEDLGSDSQFDYLPLFKRPKVSGSNQLNSAPFPPMNPMMNMPNSWPQIPLSNEDMDSNPQLDYAHPFKRPKVSGNNQPNAAPFAPVNPRMNMPNPHGNRGTGHIFYKTRMCLKFLEGSCRNGEHCTFAHGPEDLREPPPNWQEIVAAREKDKGAGNWNDDQRIIHRMKICKKFYNGGECPYGEKCNFLHEDPSKFKNEMMRSEMMRSEMERPRESSAISIGTTGPMLGHRSGSDQPEVNKHVNSSSDAFRVNMRPSYWKTKLCSKFEITGLCPFGERCHFAHGLSELQASGGQIEAEAVNISKTPTKLVSVPGNDVPTSKVVVTAPAKETGGDGKKGLSHWKSTKKINRIYADWIDDLTPPRISPRTVKN
ncbi:zinc finger CCCH domain-containing protein 39 [Diospyros lotus]|uniref:zinc finger CCCH domain-containing protein 39 n=1 Tax=Diospyros lotus TaxID=55363 RepID=UPI002252274F|nr:zinc finger CCCH domain-containing protein 39 [Diospyros lotus]XP_052198455.1 zinc finger CCCH domain-containing protein 39 [Diospyros lotus]XP_052198456.1 zinc finger CCCH domain-containing protein 39 [Diospyros lotus]